jgi:hypothetical protein
VQEASINNKAKKTQLVHCCVNFLANKTFSSLSFVAKCHSCILCLFFFLFSQVFSTSFLEQQDNVAMIAMWNGTPPTWFDLQAAQQLDFYKVSLQVCNGDALKVS